MSHIHIDVENLKFSYREDAPVLTDVSFRLSEGESVGLIGSNGAGKSTLLRTLVGLVMPVSGSVRIEEIPLEKGTLAKIREKIGYVFQDADNQLFMTTVEEDVAFGPKNYGLPKDEVDARTRDALMLCGIEHLAKRPVYQLSGGEKKLAQLATILSMHPDIMLLDEPSASLDPKNRRNLIEIVNGFDHMKIIASHDLDFIEKTCDRVLFLDGGRIVYDGPAKEVLVNEAFLIEHGL